MIYTCYLDAQDYSVLTDPKLDTPELKQIHGDLLEFARTGQVRFVFSATAVCEVIAVTPDAGRLSELKAEFLSDLCGSNALVSLDKLVRAEVLALANRTIPGHMLDLAGRWFPDIPVEDQSLQPWNRMRELAEEEMNTMGLSRQQRRATARKLVKKGNPRTAFKEFIDQQDSGIFAVELMKRYPMLPEYAEVMASYALGRASENEFTEALMSSLADPRWMMKWFSTQHAMSSPIAEIVRKPGRDLGELMRKLALISNTWATALREIDVCSDPTGKNGEITTRWLAMQNQQLVNVVQHVADTTKLSIESFTSADVDIHCPGISAGIRSLYSSVWENIGGSRKEPPSNSQPVDALHAFYAPYVNVFRADRFMAPHIQTHVRRHGTVVVPRLTQLVKILTSGASVTDNP